MQKKNDILMMTLKKILFLFQKSVMTALECTSMKLGEYNFFQLMKKLTYEKESKNEIWKQEKSLLLLTSDWLCQLQKNIWEDDLDFLI